MEEKQEILKLPIVLDIDSGKIKARFSREDKPKIIFKKYHRKA